jgi:hypothetical protein
MNAVEIAAALTEALEAAAQREAGAPCALVSVNVELLTAPAPGAPSVTLERKTRTLIFLSAALVGDDGACIASASSVHKVES